MEVKCARCDSSLALGKTALQVVPLPPPSPHGAHGVMKPHPPRMRKAQGSGHAEGWTGVRLTIQARVTSTGHALPEARVTRPRDARPPADAKAVLNGSHHRNHVGSNYKPGCCGHANLFGREFDSRANASLPLQILPPLASAREQPGEQPRPRMLRTSARISASLSSSFAAE